MRERLPIRLWRLWPALPVLLLLALLPLLQRPITPAAAASLPTAGRLAVLGKDGLPGTLCPLRHTDVVADVAGPVARVTVTQQFANPSPVPVEAVYTFPLPADAAVDAMTMTIGTRVVRGEIKRKEEARAIYEAAKAQGQAAALLDQERPNIFTQSVADILPGQAVTITIRYVHLLKYADGGYEWVYPMVVGPRYTPGGGHGDTTAVVTDADRITPPIAPPGRRAGHDISLRVHLDAGIPLGAITSVLHPIDVRRDGPSRADIALQDQSQIPNKDFILRYQVAGARVQAGLLTATLGDDPDAAPETPGRAGGYFTLLVQPPATPPAARITPKEIIFVIDQTGSQAGWPIHKAKEVMSYLIGNMNPGDSFQLLGFDTDVHPCFARPVGNTPENVAQAQRFLDPIEGSGGTDILKAVDYALSIPTDPGRRRIVCYLTDGYVGNDMQVLDYVKKHVGGAHMFPFGIGNSVNRLLIDGMAKDGQGEAEYVTLDSSAEEAAARFYRRVAQPLLTDIRVDWNGLAVTDVYPSVIPDMFLAGRPVILKGRYSQPGVGDITLHGLQNGVPWSQTVSATLPATDDGGSDAAIPTLWAREKIEDLQEQDWMGAQTGRPDPEIKERIIQTALQYRLMSQWTSFVAVEPRVVNVGGRQRTIDVPVEMPEGVSYGGIFGDNGGRPGMAAGSLFRSRAVGRAFGGAVFAGGGVASQGVSAPVAAAPAAKPASPVMARAPMPLPLLGPAPAAQDGLEAAGVGERDIAEGTAAGRKALSGLSPAQRQARLRQAKLAPALRRLLGPAAKDPAGGTVDVQIWLNTMPADGPARLKALGFDLGAVLKPGRLLLGTVSAAKLDALLDLPWIRRIEPPQYH